MNNQTPESTQLYINKCKSYIEFMLTQQQWSGLTSAEIDHWLENFKDLDISEKYYVYKLLVNIIYYSEQDVLLALKEGINNTLFHDIILKRQKENDFQLSQHALTTIVKENLGKSVFVPLLDNASPHESGNYVSRLLVQQGIIENTQSYFHFAIGKAYETQKFKNLIIVDDCVGSGDQLRGFIKNTTVSTGETKCSLISFCEDNDISLFYLTLFGYDKSIEKLTTELDKVTIRCIRKLTDTQRVFLPGSYVWESDEERSYAQSFFGALLAESQIPLLGYKGFDFAFIMHRTIPDWSLPLFWKENADWNLLMRRKNSSV